MFEFLRRWFAPATAPAPAVDDTLREEAECQRRVWTFWGQQQTYQDRLGPLFEVFYERFPDARPEKQGPT